MQISRLSGGSGRSASMAPLNGLMCIAAGLLSSDSLLGGFFLRLSYIFLSVFFLSYPWTIPVSAILSLSSYIALCYVLFHSPFSQLGNFHVWVKVMGLDHIKIISNTKSLNSHTTRSLGPVSSHMFAKYFWPCYLIMYSISLWIYIFFSDI